MKTKIIQIGNSQGIRIPKVLLQQSGLGKEVELEVKKQNIIIGPFKKSRQGWSDAFRKMAERGVDQLIDRDALVRQSSWDKSHWTW